MTHPSRAIALAVALAAGSGCSCGGDDDDDVLVEADAGGGISFEECDDSDQAFVRASFLALLGRRPASQAEAQVYADIMAGARAAAVADPTIDPREVVARAILARDGVVERWTEHFMDALRIARIEDQSFQGCYGTALRADDQGIADGALASYLRDNAPRDGDAGGGDFSMLDVLRSALYLDDVSAIYRAQLLVLVSRPITAANVPPIEAELARREDFGQVFDSAYLNRDLVCLGCHNSAQSITDHPDPALDRHWPVPGRLEEALYGDSTGIAPARAHAMFRYDGFSGLGAGTGVRPWGLDGQCGELYPDGLAPDPAGVDGKFGALTGDGLTVFDLERALARGVAALAETGLERDEDGAISDPDQAFAYLVAMSIVESVWREVVGSSLTIANYFPRNAAAAELLGALTDRFVANQFSLRELLVAILTTEYVNRLPPVAGCGDQPYTMPNLYDPWVTSDADAARRKNGPADGIAPLSGRTLVRAAYAALGWQHPDNWQFPTFGADSCLLYTCDQMFELCNDDMTCCETYDQACPIITLQKGIGVFLKNGERGFRGLDFQARLVWEDLLGRCENPGTGDDWIDQLIERAAARPIATVVDVVLALKDRLVGQGTLVDDGGIEAAAIEAVFGASLSTPVAAVGDLEGKARALCGVLISSPQFMLTGMSPPDGALVPVLTAPTDVYDAVCATAAEHGLSAGLALTCSAGGLTVTR